MKQTTNQTSRKFTRKNKKHNFPKPWQNLEFGTEDRILTYLYCHPAGATRTEISEAVLAPIQTVTGRVNQMLGEGMIFVADEKFDSNSNRTVQVLKMA